MPYALFSITTHENLDENLDGNKNWKQLRNFKGGEYREKVWEQFPDSFGEQLVSSFSNFGNSIFRILNLGTNLVTNVGESWKQYWKKSGKELLENYF